MGVRRYGTAMAAFALLTSAGCADRDRWGRQPAPAEVVLTAASAPASRPAPAPAATQPIAVRKEGRSTIRTYVVRPGEGFPADSGGLWVLLGVKEDRIVFGPDPVFALSTKNDNVVLGPDLRFAPIPLGDGEYSMGNHQYLRIISVRQNPPLAKLELRSKVPPWWDLSF